MGQYKAAVITNAGNNIIAQAVAGQGTITFTAVKTSSYSYPDGTNISGLTDLQDIQQSVLPSAAGVFNNTMIQISATFDNTEVDTMYLIQTLGIYAKLGDGNEILFAVVQATAPDQMPVHSDVSPSSFIYNIQITVQNASSITVTVDPSGAASIEDINNLQSQINVIKTDVGDLQDSVEKLETLVEVALPASGWSSAFPFTQSVAVQGFSDNDTPALVMDIDQTATVAEIKAYKKAFGLIYYGVVASGNVTFYATAKPAIDIKVALSGYTGPGTQTYSASGDLDLVNYVQVEQTGD